MVSPVGGPIVGQRYDVFISYSHSADGALAPALERGLEQLARPWNRRRALAVFRDKTGLAVTPRLWSTIVTALDDARFLVLLASPAAASSEWVQKEVAHWLHRRGSDSILLVLTDGELVWDDSRAAFTASHSSPVPESLRTAFSEEPLHLDLRWARTEEQLDLRSGRFREAVAELAAAVHGVSKNDLDSEDLRQFRRGRRVRRVGVSLLAAVAVLATALGLLASASAERARQATEQARSEARIALSRQLAADARAASGARPDLALRLAAQAYAVAPTAQALDAVTTTVFAQPSLVRYLPPSGHPLLAVDVAGETVAAVDSAGAVRQWSLRTGDVRESSFGAALHDAALDSTSEHAAAVSETGELTLLDLSSGDSRAVASGVSSAALDSTTGTLTYLTDDGRLRQVGYRGAESREVAALPADALGQPALAVRGRTVAVAAGQQLWVVEGRTEAVSALDVPPGVYPLRDVAWLPDASVLVLADTVGAVAAHDRSDRAVRTLAAGAPEQRNEVSGFLSAPSAVDVSRDGRVVAWGGGWDDGGSVRLMDSSTGQGRGVLPGRGEPVHALGFDDRGDLLAVGYGDGGLAVWTTSARPPLSVDLSTTATRLSVVAISPDGRYVASGGCRDGALHDLGDEGLYCDSGQVDVWRRDGSGRPAPVVLGSQVHSGFVEALAFTPDGRQLLSGDEDGLVVEWDLETGRHSTLDAPSAADEAASDHVPSVVALATPEEGPAVAVARFDGSVEILDRSGGDGGRVLQDPVPGFPDETPTTVSYGPDRSVAVGYSGGSVELWDAPGAARTVREGPEEFGTDGPSVAVLEFVDEELLVGSKDGTFEWRHVETGEVRRSLSVDTVSDSWDAGSGMLVAAGGGVQLFEAQAGRRLGPVLAPGVHTVSVTSSGPSPDDGELLAVGTWSDGVLVFDISPRALVRRACRLAGARLSAQEWDLFVDSRVDQVSSCPSEELAEGGGAQ